MRHFVKCSTPNLFNAVWKYSGFTIPAYIYVFKINGGQSVSNIVPYIRTVDRSLGIQTAKTVTWSLLELCFHSDQSRRLPYMHRRCLHTPPILSGGFLWSKFQPIWFLAFIVVTIAVTAFTSTKLSTIRTTSVLSQLGVDTVRLDRGPKRSYPSWSSLPIHCLSYDLVRTVFQIVDRSRMEKVMAVQLA